ncbi:MAG: response regulator [Saprospiraceae bacterium]
MIDKTNNSLKEIDVRLQNITASQKTMGDKTQILLVEDNPADVQLMQLTISEFTDEVQLTHCADGLELLHTLPHFNTSDIQLILLDLNMPRMGGIETLKHLAQNQSWSQIPVVIFTSSAHRDDIEVCYELGANAYVNKPVNFDDFTKAIHNILEFWTEVNIYNSFQ